MSEDATDPEQQTNEETTSQPQRSSVERVIVWGLIIGLGLVAFFEWRAKASFETSLKAITAGFENSNNELDLAACRTYLSGSQSELTTTREGVHNQILNFSWYGLLKPWRTYTIRLLVDPGDNSQDKQIVLYYDTDNDPNAPMGTHVAEIEEKPDLNDPQYSSSAPSETSTGSAGGTSRRRRSFEEYDKNSDKKISKDEVSETFRRFFDRIDGNDDGVLDKEEFDQMRQRSSSRGRSRSGGGNQDQGDRKRPESDEPDQTKTKSKDADKKEESKKSTDTQ